jgi:hypothetical protein
MSDQLNPTPYPCFEDGPQSVMEKALLEEYLQRKGYSLATLRNLPESQARALMVEACNYASLVMAQVESAAHIRESIHLPE